MREVYEIRPCRVLLRQISDLEIARLVSGKSSHQHADNVPEIAANVDIVEKNHNGEFY